jgi:hypothetical protein
MYDHRKSVDGGGTGKFLKSSKSCSGLSSGVLSRVVSKENDEQCLWSVCIRTENFGVW